MALGGKVEETDSSIKAAAIREFYEETHVSLLNPELVAIICWHTQDARDILCFVYFCYRWRGEPTETDEMTVDWHNLSSIPFEEMWASDRLWFPLIIQQKNLFIQLYFNSLYDTPYKMTVLCNQSLSEEIKEFADTLCLAK